MSKQHKAITMGGDPDFRESAYLIFDNNEVVQVGRSGDDNDCWRLSNGTWKQRGENGLLIGPLHTKIGPSVHLTTSRRRPFEFNACRETHCEGEYFALLPDWAYVKLEKYLRDGDHGVEQRDLFFLASVIDDVLEERRAGLVRIRDESVERIAGKGGKHLRGAIAVLQSNLTSEFGQALGEAKEALRDIKRPATMLAAYRSLQQAALWSH